MNIISAQYVKNIDGENTSITLFLSGAINNSSDDNTRMLSVPLNPNNTDYADILEWAKEDGNEIQAAE
tara:strand:- start:149 stop:352 length:204 start_codon:yes stop_codon:yes gene_type:complete